MYKFTLQELTHFSCKSKVFALGINGKYPYTEFVQEVKNNNQLTAELGDLIPAIKYFANGSTPFLPKKRFRKLKLGKLPFSVYEAKSKNLRVYLFTDKNGVINILGGTKKEQDKDLEYIKSIVKAYQSDSKK